MSGSHCDLGACITKVASWRTEEERTGLQFYAEHAQTFLADEIYETAADRSWVSCPRYHRRRLACQHILTAAGLPDGLFTTLLVADPQVPAITERL